MTIKDRYWELIGKGIQIDEAFNVINKEYFNDTLTIYRKYSDTKFIVNNRENNWISNTIEYLETLYVLESTKRKIKRIYEIN